MIVDLAPFRLIDPPEGAEEAVRRDLAAIHFDWSKVKKYVEGDPDARIDIVWRFVDPGVYARYTHFGREIAFHAPSYTPYNRHFGRVLAHEIGHMVDYAVLDNAQRNLLIQEFLDPANAQWHQGSHPEVWRATHATDYYQRIHEAFADIFVAAYAPDLFDPAYMPYRHFARVERVRAIIETRNPVEVTEIGGANRFETAQLASMRRYPYTTPVEVVIAADGSPDAFAAASYVASASEPPATLLFVVKGEDKVPDNTLREVDRLRFGSSVAKLTFVGGTAAITPAARAVIRKAAGA